MHPHLRVVAGAAAIALLAATIVAPLALAQSIGNAQLGGFGTRVKVGDIDYLPLTKRASAAIRVMEADLGTPTLVTDNCILLMNDNTDFGPARAVAVGSAQPVYIRDIRLVPCQGKAIGTGIVDTDVIERGASFIERAVEVRYGDANGNNKYDRTDPLFLTTMTGTARGLVATTAVGT